MSFVNRVAVGVILDGATNEILTYNSLQGTDTSNTIFIILILTKSLISFRVYQKSHLGWEGFEFFIS